ncbi:hypothetical protein Kisp01_69120 [Kineosporia sp. NBRC 101677]|uniref:DUF4365 domain-containing protein n=1 Tax=Kineosporia sp. NBRC 101677 TaxID=3032197 RepID=UPI0024A22850|nr:DUF4365 domain-containing protein [Kineosporia sp. NBRC 101677]GLY19898.1 hypothetical protein Kisp01_69120 [Kineosporia sp. NBRC 101677]
MLDAKQHQGKFGEDYVRVLASAAGLLVFEDDLDVDGVDLGFRATGMYGRTFSPMIEAQIKTWSTSVPANSAGHLTYRGLNEWQFNRLAGNDFTVPRFLFLICVPADHQRYTSIGTDGVMLRHLGYFVSLQAEPRIVDPDKKRKRTVKVPIANVLTVSALRRLTETQSAW